MIDNFEEVNQRISDEDKPLLTAQIEKQYMIGHQSFKV